MKVGTVPYKFYTGQTLDYQHLNANFKKCADDINYIMGKRYCHTPLMIPFKNVTDTHSGASFPANILAPARFLIRFPGDGFVIESAFIYFETVETDDQTVKVYWDGDYDSRYVDNAVTDAESTTVLPVPLEGDSFQHITPKPVLSEYLSVTAKAADGIVAASSQKQLAVRDGETYCLVIDVNTDGPSLAVAGNDCWVVLNIRSDRFGGISPATADDDVSLNPERVSVLNISSDDDVTAASINDRKNTLKSAQGVVISGDASPDDPEVDPFRMLKAECYVAWAVGEATAEPGKKWRLPATESDNDIMPRKIVERFHVVQNDADGASVITMTTAGDGQTVTVGGGYDHVSKRVTTSGVVGGTSPVALLEVSGSGLDPTTAGDDKNVTMVKTSGADGDKAYVIVWYI